MKNVIEDKKGMFTVSVWHKCDNKVYLLTHDLEWSNVFGDNTLFEDISYKDLFDIVNDDSKKYGYLFKIEKIGE